MTATSLCGSCGAENPAEAIRCTQCADYLDPSLAPAPSTEPRKLEPTPLLIAAGVATALVALFYVLGISFSMTVLPASEPIEAIGERIKEAVDAGDLAESDALAVVRQLASEAGLREQLAANRFGEAEAMAIRSRIAPSNQSTVLGLGGFFSLLLTSVALGLGSIVATAVARTARLREVGLGLLLAVVVQAGLWIASAQMDMDAITDGRLWFVGAGPAFEGAPALLLVMTLVASTAAALVAAVALGAILDHFAGRSQCPHCEHSFVAGRGTTHCPACSRPLRAPASVPLNAPGGGMTRASADADTLLCTLCAKVYAADTCPTHPREPLLDHRRDDVRFQLLELDAQAGTARFTEWTAGLSVGLDSAGPQFRADTPDAKPGLAAAGRPRSGPGLCMECAKTYEGTTCAVHPDEPLLDPTREDVRLELIEADDRQRRVVGVRLMFAAFFVALGLGLSASTLSFVDSELTIYVISGALVGLMAVARVLTPALSPRRFARWTGEGSESAEELRANARNELLAPVLGAVHKALARARLIAAATVAGAALGAAIAAGLGVGSWGAGATLGGLATFVAAVLVAALVDEAKDTGAALRQAAKEFKDPYG